MAKLLLIELYEPGQRTPILPFGWHCLASVCRDAGHQVEIMPAPEDLVRAARRWQEKKRRCSPRDLRRLAARPRVAAFLAEAVRRAPDAVGLTAFENWVNMAELALRLLKRAVKALHLIGGPFPGALGAQALDFLSADFAFLGEAEESLPRFLDILESLPAQRRTPAEVAARLEGLDSVVVAASAGRPAAGPVVARLGEPALEGLRLDWAFALDHLDRTFPDYRHNPILSYISSRGCPHACVFCSSTLGKRFRRVSAEKIVADLREIRSLASRRFQAPEKFIIAFGDDNFLHDRQRAERFFGLVAQEGLDQYFQFTFQASINCFFRDLKSTAPDLELLDMIKRANVRFLTFGTDAFSDLELRRLRKAGYSTRHIEALVRALEGRELLNNHFCILSNLRTSAQDILQTLTLIRDLDRRYKHFIQLRPIMYMAPYYGTPAWREIAADPSLRARNVEPCHFLFPPAGDTFLARKILPLDPRARRALEALDQEVETRLVKGVPYSFDLDAALAVTRRNLEEPLA